MELACTIELVRATELASTLLNAIHSQQTFNGQQKLCLALQAYNLQNKIFVTNDKAHQWIRMNFIGQ
jgi:hypothetical protein